MRVGPSRVGEEAGVDPARDSLPNGVNMDEEISSWDFLYFVAPYKERGILYEKGFRLKPFWQ